MEDWQYAGAQYVYFNGIMTGKKILSDKTAVFDAGAVMTRAEFVKALYNYEGMPIVKYQSRFKDVPNDKWYTKAILWAVRNEIVAGKGRVFDVEGLITRQDMAVMLYNYAQYKKLDVSNTKKLTGFADYKKADSYATKALKWAVGNGIINGKPSKNGKKVYLDPKGNATRGEAATILKTFVTIYKK